MGWPAGRPRPKKACAAEREREAVEMAESAEMVEVPRAPNEPPSDWTKGQLLNVRNYGSFYAVVLHGEEYSPEREHRALKFTNPGELQDFVSDWYARIGHHPLAR
jgi:hypothetical protein